MDLEGTETGTGEVTEEVPGMGTGMAPGMPRAVGGARRLPRKDPSWPWPRGPSQLRAVKLRPVAGLHLHHLVLPNLSTPGLHLHHLDLPNLSTLSRRKENLKKKWQKKKLLD